MREVATVDDYLKLIDEALYEITDMRHAIEFDEDHMALSAKFVDPLENILLELKKEVKEASHVYGGEDLAYMKIIQNLPEEIIPFKYLLKVINKIHLEASFNG